MAKTVILNRDYAKSPRRVKKLQKRIMMKKGRTWDTIKEFMSYSGYSFDSVCKLEEEGIITTR